MAKKDDSFIVTLSSVLSTTEVRSVIDYDSTQEFKIAMEKYKDIKQMKHMYTIHANEENMSLMFVYKCFGWPSKFVLEQMEKLGKLSVKVSYAPHFSLVNKLIAEKESVKGLIWFDVRVRPLESSNIVLLDNAEKPPSVKECKFMLDYFIRPSHINAVLADGTILLDSDCYPVNVVEANKERITLDQVECFASVVDVLSHLTSSYFKDSDVIFDINPSNIKWSDIPLDFMFIYDIQMRLHSPTTLRVFMTKRTLKHDKEVASVAGRKTV